MRGTSTGSVCLGSIVIVRWSSEITIEEVRGAVAAILDARRKTKRAVALVATVPREIAVPSDAVLDELAHHAPSVGKAVRFVIGVLPAAATHGRVIAGSWVAYGALIGASTDATESLEDALRRAAVAVGDDPDGVVDVAKSKGLFD